MLLVSNLGDGYSGGEPLVCVDSFLGLQRECRLGGCHHKKINLLAHRFAPFIDHIIMNRVNECAQLTSDAGLFKDFTDCCIRRTFTGLEMPFGKCPFAVLVENDEHTQVCIARGKDDTPGCMRVVKAIHA